MIHFFMGLCFVIIKNLMPLCSTLPSMDARLQPDQSGSGKDLVPIRPVAMLVHTFEGKMDEMYQLF